VRFCPQCSAFYANDVTFCPSDGRELLAVKDPYIGRTIAARYRLVRRLGTGGMSSVYLAHHVMIDRLSAIKILRQDLARHPTHKERFLREARAVNRINHPNIVEISDMGEADGVTYLVMEYVDGPSLHEELAKGAMPWPRAVRIGLQVAAALGRAHQMGVVHRDLKPENILIAKRPRDAAVQLVHAAEDLVKLTDFGIAKITDEPSLTVGERLFGTPGYIAPEYVEGSEADARSDLYGLGVILYETTTGALPFDGQGVGLLTAAVQGAIVRPTARAHPQQPYPPALEALILALLARRPEDRPPSAFAVYDALVALLPHADTHVEAALVPPPLPSTREVEHVEWPPESEPAMTVVDAELPAAVSALHTTETSDLSWSAAEVGTAGWYEALGRLEAAIGAAERDEARSAAPERLERAVEIATLARVKVRSLERASELVESQQARVDALEEEGRRFRADIGRALDQLVLDRARAETRAEEMSARLASMTEASGADPTSDAFLWETTALRVASGTSELDTDDLTFQIETLERRLEERNAELERQIVEASGALEGSLAAVRHLTHELGRMLNDATAEVRLPGQTGAPPAKGDPLWGLSGLAQAWRGAAARKA
jgi:serine/threonine-protein kinase